MASAVRGQSYRGSLRGWGGTGCLLVPKMPMASLLFPFFWWFSLVKRYYSPSPYNYFTQDYAKSSICFSALFIL